MINLKTHKEKLAEWHLQNRLRRNWETKLANQIKIEVNRTAKIIANDYAISGRQSMGNAAIGSALTNFPRVALTAL